MNSQIYVGSLSHQRLGAVEHHFKYPIYLYGFDLDELTTLDRQVPGFGHNRLRPVAIHDCDYLESGAGTLREKLDRVLSRARVSQSFARVHLVTAARYFNYVFNPVSFYFCYGETGHLECVVAEVNNTFGERHVYVLDDLVSTPEGFRTRRKINKAFHVSPFYDVAGEYDFRFADLRERLDVQIQVTRGQQVAFNAHLTGSGRPLTGRQLVRTLARYPLTAALTMPRIIVQAASLSLRKRLPVHAKPALRRGWKVRKRRPSLIDQAATAAVMRAFAALPAGSLQIKMPNGESVVVDENGTRAGSAHNRAQLHIRDHGFFRRVASGGNIGLGESYERGEWDSPDLTRLLHLLATHRARVERGAGVLGVAGRQLERIRHAMQRNGRTGSSRNVRAHYDLGNEFFSLFLDRSMSYSAARFDGAPTLDAAQARKLDLVLRKCGATTGSRVLEIGCGWGSFALRAAEKAGCTVTGVTLSSQQLFHARMGASARGLANQTQFELRDYRDLTGRFDTIVSIEMLEAVGHRNLGFFFEICDRLLARGGKVVLQVITIADRYYDSYRKQVDWIQKYIFPGGHLPSIGALSEAMARRSTLVIEDLESFGGDYVRTLEAWRARLEARWNEARALGYSESFLRRWRYYFSCCEAGFKTGEINVTQMVLGRPASAEAGQAV